MKRILFAVLAAAALASSLAACSAPSKQESAMEWLHRQGISTDK